MRLPISFFYIYPHRQLHVHCEFNIRLWKGEDEIHLASMPSINDYVNKQQSDWGPAYNRWVSLVEIDCIFLLSAMQVESGFAFICCNRKDVSIPSHGPHWIKDLLTIRNVLDRCNFLVFSIRMIVKFLPHCFLELCFVRAFYCLIIVHHVFFFCCAEGYRIR